MKKIFISLFILIFLSNCGFTPIYSKKGLSSYNVEVMNSTGDRLINHLISNRLNRSEDKSADNKINNDINSKYKKTISSRDATGAAASYELTVRTELKVSNVNDNKTFVFNERFILDKNENLSDEKNYERTIKHSFSSSISSKMIRELNSFK